MGRQAKLKATRDGKAHELRQLRHAVSRSTFYDRLRQTGFRVPHDDLQVPMPTCEVFNISSLVSDIIERGKMNLSTEISYRPPFARSFFEFSSWGMPQGVVVEYFGENFDTLAKTLDRPQFKHDTDGVMVLALLLGATGQPVYLARIAVPLDKEGRVTDVELVMDVDDVAVKGAGVAFSEFSLSLRWGFMPVMLAIGMLNCRNVVARSNPPRIEDDAVYQKHFGVPMTVYRTLAIRSFSVRSEYEAHTKTQRVLPMHIRRGNFAHYMADAPLFGKYTGTYWREATVVGSEKNGIVVKDYKVKPEPTP